jgi:hypothetical protein
MEDAFSFDTGRKKFSGPQFKGRGEEEVFGQMHLFILCFFVLICPIPLSIAIPQSLYTQVWPSVSLNSLSYLYT